MKKVLSITATVAGAAYLAAGIALLLVFQDSIKLAMGYGEGYGIELTNVYPIQNVLDLALVGVPCVVLGILSMSESMQNSQRLDLLFVVYSGVMLTVGGLLNRIGAFFNNYFTSRMEGAEGLVNMSIISGVFGWIDFLAKLSLVLLLLRGALSLGENAKKVEQT